MKMPALLLAAILRLQPGPSLAWEEPPEDYHARMVFVAESVAAEVPNSYWGLAVVTVFYWESHFSPHVHAGTRRGDVGKAICLGQHWQNGRTVEEWTARAGVDRAATRRCARETYRALRAADRWCRTKHPEHAQTLLGAFVGYGTGNTCDPKRSRWERLFHARAAMHTELLARFGLEDVGRLISD
jgi:hypothetical protein